MTDITFVLPGKSRGDLELLQDLDVERDWKHFNGGVNSWVLQTYLRLRETDISVRLSGDFERNAVNFAHVSDLADRKRPTGCFVVGVRADYPPVKWCDLHVVQNKTQVGKDSIWLPHWPQPGLIPRDMSRGNVVERVAYFGLPVNHYSRVFRTASGFFRVRSRMEKICRKIGLELVERGPDCWNDYHDVDIALGLRAFGKMPFNTKPPTKLINAWLAKVPFIGGGDSAFSQVGVAGVDFLYASNPEGVEKNLLMLVTDMQCWERLQANSCRKAQKYNVEKTRDAWIALLSKITSST